MILAPEFACLGPVLVSMPSIQITDAGCGIPIVKTDRDIGNVMACGGEQIGQTAFDHWAKFQFSRHWRHVGPVIDQCILREQADHGFGFRPVEMITIGVYQIGDF